jgi:hypothetical protein
MTCSPAPTAGESIDGKRAFTNRNNLPNQQTDHSIKETGGLNFGDQQITLASEAHILNSCAGMSSTTSSPLKSSKIMLANYIYKSICHQILVKSDLVAMPTPRSQKKIWKTPVVNCVAIATILCAVTCVPCTGDLGCTSYANRLRQTTI